MCCCLECEKIPSWPCSGMSSSTLICFDEARWSTHNGCTPDKMFYATTLITNWESVACHYTSELVCCMRHSYTGFKMRWCTLNNTTDLDEIIMIQNYNTLLCYVLYFVPVLCFTFVITLSNFAWLVSYHKLMGVAWNFSLQITFEPPNQILRTPFGYMCTWICNLKIATCCNTIFILLHITKNIGI